MSSALLSLLLKGAAAEALKREAASCKSRDLRGDPLTLLELLLLGFCSPLKGYLGGRTAVRGVRSSFVACRGRARRCVPGTCVCRPAPVVLPGLRKAGGRSARSASLVAPA